MGTQAPAPSPQRGWSPLPNFRPISIVLDGDPAPLPKKEAEPGVEPPIFGRCLLWPNGWMHEDATGYRGRPQPRRLCVRWGTSPLPQKGQSPTQFSAHVYCGRTAAWIKMPLGTEVDLGLCDIVFNVDPATPRKKWHTHTNPIFGQCLLWPNGWMKTPIGTEVDFGPAHIVLDGVPAPTKGAQ